MPLRIRLDELAKGRVREERPLAMQWCQRRLGAEYVPVHPPFKVAIDVRQAAHVVEATGRILGAFSLGCSRCGDALTLNVDTEFEHRFVAPGNLAVPDVADGDPSFNADPDVSEHDGVVVDLNDLAIEYTILAIPVAPSCVNTVTGPCEKWSVEPIVFGDVSTEEDEADLSPWAVLKNLQVPEQDEPPED